ncbi:molecular chaperone Tir [Azohydromonas caseinilytica]|uniref:Molecular chaperone Tir n=1 Tax=Azohydromonas caseinilytica TaxID=2728836 RepID=A0A848F9K1_9BURK|nr:molecular chaperone Tir [Azohydromonas caseinilytica]NML15013.1 molecular chaperone Tir [Azohydromonas caseinilytica]
MAYVGAPFRHDIFVSYSHGADASVASEGEDPPLKQWSLAFVRQLKEELRVNRALRETLSIFVDSQGQAGQRLDRMAPLTDQLDEQVGASALLMVLLSPDYQASRWCRQEREWWWARQAATGLAPSGRVAMVRAWPLLDPWPDNRWPPELCDSAGEPLPGYPFHETIGDEARPLGYAERRTQFGPEVVKAVIKLAGEIRQKLETVKADAARQAAERADREKLASDGGQAIYLHGRTEYAQLWDRKFQELSSGGYAVFPADGPDPIERDPARLDTIRERRIALMARCDALVLLGTQDGYALDDDMLAIGKHDRESARARYARSLPCAWLDTVGPPILNPRRLTNARILRSDWLDGREQPAHVVVKQWLADKAAQGQQP